MTAALALLQRTFPTADCSTGRLYQAKVGGRWRNIAAHDTADALRLAQRLGTVSDIVEVTR